MSKPLIKVGTRNSQLALTQSGLVTKELEGRFPEYKFELIPIVTTGDYRRDKLGLSVEDKKQWIIEIEGRLLAREIDLAIHSAKDVPLNIESGTKLIPVMKRASAKDVLLISEDKTLEDANSILKLIPAGVCLGTSSKRRKAQILHARKDLSVLDLKGNINTRVEKLKNSNTYFGIILAEAGISRLGVDGIKIFPFSVEEMLPSVGQGQLVAQCLEDNNKIDEMLGVLADDSVKNCFFAERKVVEILGADCHSAVGVYAEYLESDSVRISASVFSREGDDKISKVLRGSSSDIHSLSIKLSQDLLDSGAKELLFR